MPSASTFESPGCAPLEARHRRPLSTSPPRPSTTYTSILWAQFRYAGPGRHRPTVAEKLQDRGVEERQETYDPLVGWKLDMDFRLGNLG